MDSTPVLYTYFRSSSAARVRIALNLKHIAYEARPINLAAGEHLSEAYTSQNPEALLPYMIIDGNAISQSVAILEYLEETRPEVPLLPKDPAHRAQVRAIVGAICCEIQPLQNLRVLKTLPKDQQAEHAHGVIARGLGVVEKMLEKCAGKFCVGDQVTLADCCLIPQLGNAHRFAVDLSPFPLIQAVEANANSLDAFRQAHWTQQPDCPPELKNNSG
ncbi:Glutathione S-transferase zeta-1 [Coemansia sp. RSA 1822]|nr:Glutathione S-transferase zeta-1 [Coemansia sp. RSA 638]KAJ2542365.1 Glutathione S-transferase zeta-1 [Coemansia sp. RSA 1853]KAJ2562318.1 Glutathione S-transferase zeta-1 [Coemansia sp. RSA 1822]